MRHTFASGRASRFSFAFGNDDVDGDGGGDAVGDGDWTVTPITTKTVNVGSIFHILNNSFWLNCLKH